MTFGGGNVYILLSLILLSPADKTALVNVHSKPIHNHHRQQQHNIALHLTPARDSLTILLHLVLQTS